MSSLDLGVIGNCAVAFLIDRLGRVVWGCLPRFDGDPVFCRLLDARALPAPDAPADPDDGGFFDVAIERLARSEQRYRRNTAVLVTTLHDADGGAVEIVDFAPRFKRLDRLFRPMMMMRRVRPIAGHPRIRIRLRPRFGWGAVRPQRTRGSNHVRYVGPEFTLRLTTDAPITYVTDEVPFVLERPLTLVLGPDESLASGIEETSRTFFDATCEYWREWSRYLAVPVDWQEAVIRAAITLKLSAFEESGAIVAALTTSIPEAPASGRNWDYRYCRLRYADRLRRPRSN